MLKPGLRHGVFSCLTFLGLVSLLFPPPLAAHTPVQGLGEFANGFLHPFLTLPHLLLLVSLGLLLGQRPALRLFPPLLALAASAAAGLLAATAHLVPGVPLPLLVALTLVLGGLVALSAPLPPGLRLAACAAAGLALGLDSGVDLDLGGAALARMLVATWIGLLVGVGDLAFYVGQLPARQWTRIGVRVVGSWIVAITLLMLAFALRR